MAVQLRCPPSSVLCLSVRPVASVPSSRQSVRSFRPSVLLWRTPMSVRPPRRPSRFVVRRRPSHNVRPSRPPSSSSSIQKNSKENNNKQQIIIYMYIYIYTKIYTSPPTPTPIFSFLIIYQVFIPPCLSFGSSGGCPFTAPVRFPIRGGKEWLWPAFVSRQAPTTTTTRVMPKRHGLHPTLRAGGRYPRRRRRRWYQIFPIKLYQ